jgi:outer membrane immunogenic protein
MRCLKLFFYGLVAANSLCAIGVVSAADLPARTYTKAPIVEPVSNWTGCYVGANVGGGSNREAYTNQNPNRLPHFDLGSESANGAMGGGQVGCDYQISNWVIGGQGMFDATGFKGSNHVVPAPGSSQFPNIFDLSSSASWVTTATARLGYAIEPQLLVYARGGAAWMRSSLSYTITGMGIVVPYTGVETRAGWTVGGGLEYLIAPNWSIAAEYIHMDFGNNILTTQGVLAGSGTEPIQITRRSDAATLGVNYRFGSPVR